MSLYKYPYPRSSRQNAPPPVGITEFEILKASHKFLRDEDEKPSSWDEQLAGKYYSNLYREFAVCDLKHYKSGNFALRWRTEDEVLSGSGETTCGNTRCPLHFNIKATPNTQLTTLELPFTYQEHGAAKSALVKVVLCTKCVRKLMWKRTKEKGREGEGEKEAEAEAEADKREDKEEKKEKGGEEGATSVRVKLEEDGDDSFDQRRRKKRSRNEAGAEEEEDKGEKSSRRRRKKSSLSKSPRPSHRT